MSISMLLWCPQCNKRHIDEGEFSIKQHHTHACQECGMVWRPAIEPTKGVRFLPGFKNETLCNFTEQCKNVAAYTSSSKHEDLNVCSAHYLTMVQDDQKFFTKIE